MEKKESIFNKQSNWMSACRRTQIDPYLSPCTQLKSKRTEDGDIKPNALRLVEEEVGKSPVLMDTGDNF